MILSLEALEHYLLPWTFQLSVGPRKVLLIHSKALQAERENVGFEPLSRLGSEYLFRDFRRKGLKRVSRCNRDEPSGAAGDCHSVLRAKFLVS